MPIAGTVDTVQGGDRNSRSNSKKIAGAAWKPKSAESGSGGSQSGRINFGSICTIRRSASLLFSAQGLLTYGADSPVEDTNENLHGCTGH